MFPVHKELSSVCKFEKYAMFSDSYLPMCAFVVIFFYLKDQYILS